MAIPVTRKESLDYCFKQGYAVFPCNKEKIPTVESWDAEADVFTNLESIEKSTSWTLESNIGINCGLSELEVIDCDVKDSKNGIDNFIEICARVGFDPKKTRIVQTPSIGWHVYFLNPKGYKLTRISKKDKEKELDPLMHGIDIKGIGGYVIAPGSETKEGNYKVINDVDPIEIPEELVKELMRLTKKPSSKKKKKAKPFPETEENRHKIKMALKEIEANCDYEEWGQWILSVRSLVVHQGWTDTGNTAIRHELINWCRTSEKHTWDHKCQKLFYGWWDGDVRDQDQAITHLTLLKEASDIRNAKDDEVMRKHMKEFQDSIKEEHDAEYIEELNALAEANGICQYTNGQVHEVAQTPSKKTSETKAESNNKTKSESKPKSKTKAEPDTRSNLEIMYDEFHFFYAGDNIAVIPKDEWEAFSNFKFDEPPTLEKSDSQITAVTRVFFQKHQRDIDDAEAKNLLKKFKKSAEAIKKTGFIFNNKDSKILSSAPKNFATVYKSDRKQLDQYNWGTIKGFIEEVLSNDDENEYWQTMWNIADTYRNPQRKSGVMTHLLSEKGGTGKSSFFRLLEKIFGKGVCITTQNLNQIVGDHTDSLFRSLVICLDEFDLRKDPKAIGAIKHLVTAPTIRIRGLYGKPSNHNSGHRFWTAGNDYQTKDTSVGDRRDRFIRVNDKYAGNTKYWERLHKAFNSEERNEMVGYMLALDIPENFASERKRNSEYDRQIEASLKGIEKFIYDVADTGEITIPVGGGKWDYEDYDISGGSFITKSVLNEILDRHPEYQQKYGKLTRNRRNEFLRKLGLQDTKENGERGWKLPPLRELRDKLSIHLGLQNKQWEKRI